MKKRNRIFKFLCLLLCVFALTGCTKPITTVQDKCSVMMSLEDYDQGEKFGNYGEKSGTYKINEYAKEQGYLLPSPEFNEFMENKIDEYVSELKTYVNEKGEKPYLNQTDKYLRAIATFGGSKTYVGETSNLNYQKNELWVNYDAWLNEARNELGPEKCPDNNYVSYYKSVFNSTVSAYTTTITPVDGEFNGITLEGKTWKEAFDYGLIEGLLVYPISFLLHTFTTAFGTNGWGQILAILLVTIIVRAILILCTFKQTLSQQKMTKLQPELAKIQAKYPNSQTNQYEKQRMAQEQMALYKKHKINPMGMLVIMIFQFPIFIAVWGAMQGSAVLMTGNLLGLSLAQTTSTAMFDFSSTVCIVAWVIFILMALGQIVSMKVPQWLQKRRTQNVQKLGKNPSAEQSQKTMNMVNNIMIIFIIFMGLSLPVAMAIYWFITSLISLLQTYIMQVLLNKDDGKKHVKYKTKK